MPFLRGIFKGRDGAARKRAHDESLANGLQAAPRWQDAWQRTEVEPEEVQELLRGCTSEIKQRGLDIPFLLLPFRPASDPSGAKTFIRNYFGADTGHGPTLQGEPLLQELRMVEPLVLCSVLKWCWSRLPGGVVTWEAYELFKIGESDSDGARDSFKTFIPISTPSEARSRIIFDFFELLAAVAAHGKNNGFGGRKLSRYAGWWAFTITDAGNGFDGGYKTWIDAANATSHLFFAYLRSMSSDDRTGILNLPRSLQQLLETTEYPPQNQSSLQVSTTRVGMIVNTVSPTPFTLLRRGKSFRYRDEDELLQAYSDFDDPVMALSDECRRVLQSIATANDSSNSEMSTSLRDASWSRFEDLGFGGFGDSTGIPNGGKSSGPAGRKPPPLALKSGAASDLKAGRPTTPSWADFLSSGFVDDHKAGSSFLPPDKHLPPLAERANSSMSQPLSEMGDDSLEPGELASITNFPLDEAFWWVWMTSLASEESAARKAAFGRCALVETRLQGGKWLVLEEIIKGAAPAPEAGAYIAPKKSRFGFSRRNRNKSSGKGASPKASASKPTGPDVSPSAANRANIAPDQHARIQQAAAALQEKHRQQGPQDVATRRARQADAMSKTNSILTLQPNILSEAAPALKWASHYDKETVRAQYLGADLAGKGSTLDMANQPSPIESRTPSMNEPEPKVVTTITAGRQAPRDEPQASSRINSSLVDTLRTGPPGGRSGSVTPNKQVRMDAGRTPSPHAAQSKGIPLQVGSAAARPNEASTGPQSISRSSPAQPQPQSVLPSTPRSSDRKALPLSREGANSKTPSKAPPSSDSKAAEPESSRRPSVEAPTQPLAAPTTPTKIRKRRQEHAAAMHGGGGFKNIFNRRKDHDSRPLAQRDPNSSASAVAAARAALEAKNGQGQPPEQEQQKVLTKRFSVIGRRNAPRDSPQPHGPASQPVTRAASAQGQVPAQGSPPNVRSNEVAAAPVVRPREVEGVSRPISNLTEAHNIPDDGSVSAIDPAEAERAEREFRSFDQGPLEDVPAFVPEDDSPRSHPPRSHGSRERAQLAAPSQAAADFPKRNSSLVTAPSEPDASAEAEVPAAAPTTAAETATAKTQPEVEDPQTQISPNDRWAQIRKNAAERAAARQNEELKRQAADRSGAGPGEANEPEETIESRVARIKARVAELTGNMDTANPALQRN